MVRIRPFSPNTTPVPSRSAPRFSAVRALGTALIESFTTASSGASSARSSGTERWAARQEDNAAAKNETLTVAADRGAGGWTPAGWCGQCYRGTRHAATGLGGNRAGNDKGTSPLVHDKSLLKLKWGMARGLCPLVP